MTHDNWKTPHKFYAELDSEFHFDFDPCPLHSTFDGLKIPWGRSNFVNPPYSRELKDKFVKKALSESKKGKLCVILLPVRTSTILFQDVIFPNAHEIRFLRGRLSFQGIDSTGKLVDKPTGMFGNMLVVFRPKVTP